MAKQFTHYLHNTSCVLILQLAEGFCCNLGHVNKGMSLTTVKAQQGVCKKPVVLHGAGRQSEIQMTECIHGPYTIVATRITNLSSATPPPSPTLTLNYVNSQNRFKTGS